jgi:hypothetical protein
VFEKRVMSIFGSKRDDVSGERRKLHNEKFNTLYSSPNITLGNTHFGASNVRPVSGYS